MTRDEILNMPAGRELDALIAETVLHKKVIRESSGRPHFLTTPYSKDIGSAWEVVRNMPDGYELRLHQHKLIRESWHAEFHQPGTETFMVLAGTVPLAICRAALLAVMEKA